eukprot:gnl/TRDRNA2_/TRDRNA2_173484_c9_seq1.p1 gnl/TRDRNA2_/TRDRNA2_173484_c9~~gnl/TRDRNA2_/TRDRNA2_173484_c9_seq1.p1  ORF type:complete len:443 (-),score=68.33 gnl/TRDRNA2_/TRDRNA2_173484_c9_seq1:166-1494(-)
MGDIISADVNQPAPPEYSTKQLSIKYDIGRKLGEGAFGLVREARSKKSTTICAVKIVKFKEQQDVKAAEDEITVWMAVGKHKHCVQFHEAFKSNKLCYLIMEFCDCSLVNLLERPDFTVEMEAPRLFRGMMLGIEHLHGLRIVHGDVKPNNYLLGYDKKTIKLADFGCSIMLPAKKKLRGVVGTPQYMSPEMLTPRGTWDEGIDIWSFGASAYVILFGVFPYMPSKLNHVFAGISPRLPRNLKAEEDMKKAIVADHPKPRYVATAAMKWKPPDCAADFVKCLLQRTASDRPTMKQALLHPFLRQVGTCVTGMEVSLAPQLKQESGSCDGFKSHDPFKHPVDAVVQMASNASLEKLRPGLRTSLSEGTKAKSRTNEEGGCSGFLSKNFLKVFASSTPPILADLAQSNVDIELMRRSITRSTDAEVSTDEGSSRSIADDSVASD